MEYSKIFLGFDGQEEDFTLLAQGWIFSKGFPAKTPPLNCLFISNRRPIFTTPALMTSKMMEPGSPLAHCVCGLTAEIILYITEGKIKTQYPGSRGVRGHFDLNVMREQ